MPNEITLEYAASLLPKRPEDGHKGTFGHALLIAGSRGYSGAAKLAAEAACRSGAGLVTLATPESQQPIAAAGLLETMTLALPETPHQTIAAAAAASADEASRTRDAVGLGPGLSQEQETGVFVREFVPACAKPLVIDADGLNLIAGKPNAIANRAAPTIVTPHPGEMARLAGCSTSDVAADRPGTAVRFAKEHHCVVVLKGARTVVAGPAIDPFENPTGNSGMATGGTGDVLTGLITGLLAQGCAAIDAAVLGVYVHGLAGDIAADAYTGRGMIAGDVVECIPDAWALLEAHAS